MTLNKEQRAYVRKQAGEAVNRKIDAACGNPPNRHFMADALVGVKLTREQAEYIAKTDYREHGALKRLFPTIAEADLKFIAASKEYDAKVRAVRKKLQPLVDEVERLAFIGSADAAREALEKLEAAMV